MNINHILSTAMALGSLLLMGCYEETGRTVYPYSVPRISGLTLSTDKQLAYGDSLFFSLDINNPETPLSTLEEELSADGQSLYKESIRTKGNEASIRRHGLSVPFDMDREDTPLTLTLTAINVEGGSQQLTRQLSLVRPELPETLFLHYNDQVIEMHRQADNPFLYATPEGDYPETFSARIATDASLAQSKYVWGHAETAGYATLSNPTGAAFSFDYSDWKVRQVTFNAYTFKFGAIGVYQKLMLNNVEMALAGGYYKATVSLQPNDRVTLTGITDLEKAYNRDFFSYNSADNSLTFTGPAGSWDVYYSPAYNYMWVARMTDVAPEGYWLVGHGFTAAPRWSDDYATGGWGLEDIFRLGYIVKTADNKYQTTVYLNNNHEWGSFEVEIYSDLAWGKDRGMQLQEGSLSGDTQGIKVSKSNGITSDTGFVPGYFRLTFDNSQGVGRETLHIKRLSY